MPSWRNILGISAFYHDAAAALLRDGRIAAAAQEERFTRRKHDARFPRNAVAYCLAFASRGMAALRHALLSAFCERTGCPVVVNTSFNVRGEPLVRAPEDAFQCFVGTQIDALAAGNCFLRKEDQDPKLWRDLGNTFSPA